jgi:hypothetical protein
VKVRPRFRPFKDVRSDIKLFQRLAKLHGQKAAGRRVAQSNLDVGPNSSVKLNMFIYDPNRSGGKAVLDATKGSFRFTTGAQGGGATHQIKTPYGTLGIRG